mmetsp:Transcript_15069/g.32437  ORF Transcript_15069/g.32437 Transcript_15069/m.32437 type:complete len:259 (-) Transcript_15069:13-789(-)
MSSAFKIHKMSLRTSLVALQRLRRLWPVGKAGYISQCERNDSTAEVEALGRGISCSTSPSCAKSLMMGDRQSQRGGTSNKCPSAERRRSGAMSASSGGGGGAGGAGGTQAGIFEAAIGTAGAGVVRSVGAAVESAAASSVVTAVAGAVAAVSAVVVGVAVAEAFIEEAGSLASLSAFSSIVGSSLHSKGASRGPWSANATRGPRLLLPPPDRLGMSAILSSVCFRLCFCFRFRNAVAFALRVQNSRAPDFHTMRTCRG